MSSSGRPLVIVHDEELLDDVLRLAGVIGVEIEAEVDISAVPSGWEKAPLVVLDAEAARGCRPHSDSGDVSLSRGLSRRGGVVLICRGAPDTGLWREAVRVGAELVLSIPKDEALLADRFADVLDTASEHGRIIGVVGGVGGAGSTVLAVGLACAESHRKRSPLLVDLDPYGGGIATLLGPSVPDGSCWSDIQPLTGRVSAAALHAALPKINGVSILSFSPKASAGLTPDAVVAVMSAGRRAGDLVVVDMARQPSAEMTAAVRAMDVVLLVVPTYPRAVLAATRIRNYLGEHSADVRLIARQARSYSSAPAEIARALMLPLAGYFRLTPSRLSDLDRGASVISHGRFATFCRTLLTALDRDERVVRHDT